MQLPSSVIRCIALAAHLCKLPTPSTIPIPPGGVLNESDIENCARQFNLTVDIVQGVQLEDLAVRPLQGPVALVMQDGTAVLFVGRVRNKPLAAVLDPGQEPLQQRQIPFLELAAQWTGIALLLTPGRAPHRHVNALVSIARNYGKDLSADEIIHTYLLKNHEPDPNLFLRMLGEYGFEGHTANLNLEGLEQIPTCLPALLHCRQGGVLILWQIDKTSLEVENPDQPQLGRTTVARREVELLLDGQVTFVKLAAVGQIGPASQPRFGFSFFWNEIRQMSANMSEVGLAAVVLQILGLAMPLFFQIIIDKVVTHHAQTTLHILALGMLAAILFEAAFGWLRSYLLLYATSVIDLRLAIRTFEHLSSIDLST